MNARIFQCRIHDGTYQGEVTVWVDSEAIERFGNEAIEQAAWKEYRRYSPPFAVAYRNVEILQELARVQD